MRTHLFSVDVEEYFHPTALARHYPQPDWAGLPRRSPGVIDRLLDFLADRDVHATFFILGWLAEKEPGMVRAIADGGHEIASHGWEHELVGVLGPDAFRSSVQRSRATLQELTGQEVIGYRAPSFSIVPGSEWAFDILLDEGYRYDASLFPVTQHPTYGYPAADRDPFVIARPGGRLAEFPSTTAQIAAMTLPASGGAYFRILPYGLVRAGMRQAETRHAPGMFYIHPWELDEWVPPNPGASRTQMFRTFHGRRRTWSRLERLFDEFRFGPVRDSLPDLLAHAPGRALGADQAQAP